ncbi:conserved hypothetical protein [Histoplasma capsulatum var. duboisii H88]|uniref:C2H2-type domain-containing protein n=1 Tax=Ajellomyces capsulatus (strain H88) TaxID=544711 RepID=F0UGL5_AJEC8|nr:conserved hypothetical protein [Histoplasma capsulatum var. duboisii H88]
MGIRNGKGPVVQVSEPVSDCDDTSESDVFTDGGPDSDTDDTDLDTDDEAEQLLREHKLPPPEHYLQEEANVDVSHLRQRRYKPGTIKGTDRARDYWNRYCSYVKRDAQQAYETLSAQSLKAFFSWACDQRRGKDGRRIPGIRTVSSLETFWKQYSQVYKIDTSHPIDALVMAQAQDVIALVADEKKLSRDKRPKGTMYVDDLAEFARVLLATTDMLFLIGWLRIQLILYCHLAGITGNRPEALLEPRYRHLELTLIRDPLGGPPRLIIEFTAEFTKGYLGIKDQLPEIIFDPTLILSPHVFLLGMLFHIKAFKSPIITSPEKLYDLGVLNGLNQQRVPLRADLDDKFVFCQAVREGDAVHLIRELKLTSSSLRYRMKKGGEITGFEDVTKPYVLRDGAAKALNESPDVSDSLQNLILQHSSIDTFLKHYLDRNITADVLSIYRGLKPQRALMRLASSMSRSIDPRRPWKLTPAQSKSVNDQPLIAALARRVERLRRRCNSARGTRKYKVRDEKYGKALRELRSEKQQARVRLKREILKRYKEEQPLIDIERQLTGKLIGNEVKDVLERSNYMAPERLNLIDAILTLPPNSPDAELQRRITAIRAVTVYCGVEEGRTVPYFDHSNPDPGPESTPSKPPERRSPGTAGTARPVLPLHQAIHVVQTEQRPKICFICLNNGVIRSYASPGDLTKHFRRCHLDKFKPMCCKMCNVDLRTQKDLLLHAEAVHGTVTRVSKYRSCI